MNITLVLGPLLVCLAGLVYMVIVRDFLHVARIAFAVGLFLVLMALASHALTFSVR